MSFERVWISAGALAGDSDGAGQQSGAVDHPLVRRLLVNHFVVKIAGMP
jgi:hypothetical protein